MIRLNEPVLVDCWEFRVDTDELLRRLQQLPESDEVSTLSAAASPGR